MTPPAAAKAPHPLARQGLARHRRPLEQVREERAPGPELQVPDQERVPPFWDDFANARVSDRPVIDRIRVARDRVDPVHGCDPCLIGLPALVQPG